MKPLRTFLIRSRFDVEMLNNFITRRWKAPCDAGFPYVVEIYQQGKKPSVRARKYYFAILGEVAEQAWVDGKQFSSEAWHAFYCEKFIGWDDLPGGGRRYISSTTLDNQTFGEFIERVKAHATTELECHLTS